MHIFSVGQQPNSGPGRVTVRIVDHTQFDTRMHPVGVL